MKWRFIYYLEPEGRTTERSPEDNEIIGGGEKILANASIKSRTVDEIITTLHVS